MARKGDASERKTGFATAVEAAEFFRVSKHTIYRLINTEKLPAVTVGIQRRIPWDAIYKMASGA